MSYYFRISVYILLIIICLCFMTMTASAQNTSDQVSTLTVDAGQRGATIEKTHYGIFFEEINHAGDGGLSATSLKGLPRGIYIKAGRKYYVR